MNFEFVFIRHGESTSNITKEIPCEKKDLLIELTETGKNQAKITKELLQNESFDNVFSSDMIRAKQTAEIIFGDRYEILLDKRLRETYVSLDDDFILNYEPLTKEEINHLYLIGFTSGERFENHVKRMKNFIDMLLTGNHGKKIAIITHSGSIKTLGCVFNNVAIEEAFYLPKVDNG